MDITCCHKNNRSKDIVVHGILIVGQLYSSEIVILYLNPSDPHTNIHNSMQYDIMYDPRFAQFLLKSFVNIGRNLHPIRIQTSIFYSKNYL